MGRIQIQSRLRPIAKLLMEVDRSKGIHDVFFDFVELSARALHSVVLQYGADRQPFQENEEAYMAVVRRYKPDALAELKQAFHMLPELLDPMNDVLGALFGALELHNKWRGQFFTPFDVSKLMAKLVGTPTPEDLEEKGFITVLEPTCGSGGMLIAQADAMLDAGFNPQTQMHVTATDIDTRCFNMTYVQLSMLGIPGIIHLGNSLSRDPPSRSWYTPAHAMGLWTFKLRRHYRELAERAGVPAEVQQAWDKASVAERFDLVARSGGEPASIHAGLVPFGVRDLMVELVPT